MMLVQILICFLMGRCASYVQSPLTGSENVHTLKIPFCRRGHGQMNALHIDEESGVRKYGVLIFGGDGINYEQPSPGSTFLQDLWILSIAKKVVNSFHKNGEQQEYSHVWQRITEENPVTSIGSAAASSTPVKTLWPNRRWNFGYTTSEEGWFILYGGEDATNNVHYDDTWVFYENKWLELQAFNGPYPGMGPGRRKGASLLLMPISGLIILWGGQRPPIGGGKRPSNSLSSVYVEEEEGVGGRGRGRWRGPYVQCLSDTYIFNATAAIKKAAPNNYKHPREEFPRAHLHLEEWRRGSDFPGSCLYGTEAVGILDPTDGREKLFAFGGRYRSSSFSTAESEAGYLLSDTIWMYDPLWDMWTSIQKDSSHAVNWPEGRDKLAMAFVAELNTVFVSGGRLADPTTPTGDADDGGSIDVVDMDLWGYDLVTRKWSQYGDRSYDDDYISDETPVTQSDDAAVTSESDAVAPAAVTEGSSFRSERGGVDNNKWWVGVAGDLPAARYQHGLSVWHGEDGTDRPFLVCFGGERSDTPWKLQGTQRNLRHRTQLQGARPGSDQTAIDDDSFSGSGAGGADNDNVAILGPVSSHAQSNDLWLLPLPTSNSDSRYQGFDALESAAELYSDADAFETVSRLDSVESLLSGGGDSGSRGKGRGNVKGDPRRHRQPPARHRSYNNSSNSTGAAGGSNSTVIVNRNDSSGDDSRSGWALLSAGGCHYLDDGSQNDRSVDVAALLIVGSFALAALMGLLGYQMLKRILVGRSEPPLGVGPVPTPPGTPSARNPMELSSESLLRYIPASIIPLGIGARLRGYTDITEDSVDDPRSVGTAGSPSVTSKSVDSDSSFGSALSHITEMHAYNT